VYHRVVIGLVLPQNGWKIGSSFLSQSCSVVMQDLLFSSHRSENCSKKFALIGLEYIAWIFSTNHRAYKNHKPHHCKNTCWCAVTIQKQTIILKVLNWCFLQRKLSELLTKSQRTTQRQWEVSQLNLNRNTSVECVTRTRILIIVIIIHWTHYLFSDWPKAYS